MGLGRGLVNLFKNWGKGIGNAADNFLLGADARKAISDEIEKKFQPKIDLARRAESRRADNIKDLGDKVSKSKKDLADAQKAWQDKYDTALADAKNQRQLDIDGYNTQLQGYNDALANANTSKQGILAQLRDSEANYNPYNTIFTDVNTGKNYIFDPFTSKYKSLNSLTAKEKKDFQKNYRNFEYRLLDKSSNKVKVINAFDDSDAQSYANNNIFNGYLNRIKAQNTNLRDAENQIKQANDDLTTWQGNTTQPKAWGKKDLTQFEKDFEKNNGTSPTEYSFNGKNYSSEPELDKAYKDALAREQNMQSLDSGRASRYASKRDAEIAQRIQDAKDIKKAKLALGGALGAGALYAGAKAMYGSDDTDSTDNINNTDNTDNIDNTDYGKPDPKIKIENTPEGKAILNGKPFDTGFNPDEANALASAAYDQGVEDGNSVRSSADLGNNIGASTGGHTIDDKLFELIKAMEDPYEADAVANYIYSRHGDDPEVQNLGWRAWLNKYYGDSLRSMMNIDPSGYKGMHISGGL